MFVSQRDGLASIVHLSLELPFQSEIKEGTMKSRSKVRYNIFIMVVLLLVGFMCCLFGFFDPGASQWSVYFIIASFQFVAALLFLGLYLKYR
jgi:hypothetical protein